MTFLRRTAGAFIACLAVVGFMAPLAAADHAGEVVELSKSEGLEDGESITLTWSNFQPNEEANFVVVGEFPITGFPTRLNLDEFGDFTAPTDENGAGTGEFVVTKDHGLDTAGDPLVCGGDTRCWVVVQQVPFPEGWYNGVEITFAGDEVEESTTTTEAPVEETTTTTEVEVTTTTENPVNDSVTTSTAAEDDDSSNTGLIIGGVIVAAAVIGGGAFAMNKKKSGGEPQA